MGSLLSVLVIFAVCYAIVIVWWGSRDDDVARMLRPGGEVLRPGMRYSVGGTVYTFDADSVPPQRFWSRPVLMPESVMLKMREMTSRVFGALSVSAWLSSTSLLSFVRGGTVSPTESVLELNMMFADRKVLFSSEMHTRCRSQFGLEINLTRGAESGRCIRITMLEDKGDEVVARVRFVGDAGHNTLAVVTSWSDDAVELCTKHRWPRDWVLPVSKETISGIEVGVPAKPDFVLFKEFNGA
jgi:hypothetical protein